MADNHRLLIDALKAILEPQFDVVGTVTDGRSLLEAAKKLRPDVIVLDIAMPQLNGLDAGRQLKQKIPGVKLVFMTMNEDAYLVGEAFRRRWLCVHSEASGGIRTDRCPRASAERRLLRFATGRKRSGHHFLREPKNREHAPEPTARQRRSDSIARRRPLHERSCTRVEITKRTVASHKYSVMELLQIKTSAELVQYRNQERHNFGLAETFFPRTVSFANIQKLECRARSLRMPTSSQRDVGSRREIAG